MTAHFLWWRSSQTPSQQQSLHSSSQLLMSMISPVSLLQTMVSSTRLVPFKNSAAAMGSPMSSQACCTLSRMILLKGRYKLWRTFFKSVKKLVKTHIWQCSVSVALSHDLPSPAELLNGRVYQTKLPGSSKPQFSADGDINAKLQVRQDKQKEQYDKAAEQPLCPIFPEDHVYILDPPNDTCRPGVIQCVTDTLRSYLVATKRGGVLQRNRRHLRKTWESLQCSKNEVSEDIPVANPIAAADPIPVVHRCRNFHILATTCAAPHLFAGF